jgi:hypothetical protein
LLCFWLKEGERDFFLLFQRWLFFMQDWINIQSGDAEGAFTEMKPNNRADRV